MVNLGSVDRAIRMIVGVVLIVLPFVMQGEGPVMSAMGGFAWLSFLVGAVLVLTALFRFCPAYMLFGIRTCKIGASRNK
jgi:predicted phage tail protein